MSDRSGKRVIGNRLAPTCMIEYCCPKCEFTALLDAYRGPPTCPSPDHLPEFMVPKVLMEHG